MFAVAVGISIMLTVWLLTVIVRARGKRMSMLFFFLVCAIRLTGSAARLLTQLYEALDRFAVSWRMLGTQERRLSEIDQLIDLEPAEDDQKEVAENGQTQTPMHPAVAR